MEVFLLSETFPHCILCTSLKGLQTENSPSGFSFLLAFYLLLLDAEKALGRTLRDCSLSTQLSKSEYFQPHREATYLVSWFLFIFWICVFFLLELTCIGSTKLVALGASRVSLGGRRQEKDAGLGMWRRVVGPGPQ